jgi:DNA-binding transcriptional LysR family regulator
MLLQEPLVLVLWEGHRLADRVDVTLEALKDEQFVLYPRTPRPSFADQVIDLCVRSGFVPHVAQEAQETQTAISLAAAGIGITLVPSSIEKLRWPGVIYRPIAPPAPLSELIAAYRPDDESPVLHAFLDVVRRTMPLARDQSAPLRP